MAELLRQAIQPTVQVDLPCLEERLQVVTCFFKSQMKVLTPEPFVWQPEKCTHSGVCVRTLPKVYDPKAKPWVTPEHATSQEIIDQVAMCPSGALSIKG